MTLRVAGQYQDFLILAVLFEKQPTSLRGL